MKLKKPDIITINLILDRYISPGINQMPRNPFLKKAMKQTLQFKIMEKLPSIYRNKKFKHIAVHYIRYSSSRMDTDNLYSSFKWIGDALVKIGLVVDDSPDNLQLTCQQIISIHSSTKLIIKINKQYADKNE